jgi:plasmid segregation protein ParM
MRKIVRSIDVGYGNTKYVHACRGQAVACRDYPSLAPVATRGELADALGRRRRTIEVDIDGIRYEVGPDVGLARGAFAARNMDDDFCTTPEYLALVRGALYSMEVDAIDLLVVGLPVSTFAAKRQVLERRLTGTHLIVRRTVEVRRVKVLAQPHGALLQYSAGLGRDFMRDRRTLMIDCGARTFDFLVTDGMKAIEKRSGAVNRGMLDVVTVLAEQIGREQSTRFEDLDRIDKALRGKSTLTVFGNEHDLFKHVGLAQKVAQDAVTEMRRQVQDGSDIDNIIVAGGGGFFFKPMIEAAFPRHKVVHLADGMYANVRGFQLFGTGRMLHEEARTRAGDPAVTEA